MRAGGAGGGGVRPTAASLATILAIGFVLAPGSNCRAQGLAAMRLKSVAAQPIAPYKLTGVDGYALVRYLSDESASGATGGITANRWRQTTLTEELFVLTHNYIYHPTLLTLDVGGGPIIDRVTNDINDVKSNDRRQTFNFVAAASILREKPYNGDLFYSRRTDTQNLGSSLQIPTETERYGATLRLLSPVTPVPTELNVTRTTNQGKNTELITDDQTDQLTLRMSITLGKEASSRLNFVATRQNTASGSTQLPITASRSEDNRLTLDTTLKLGDRNQYDLTNTINLSKNTQTTGQNPAIRSQDLNFGLDFRGWHSEELRSTARYNLIVAKQGDFDSTSHSAGAGITLMMTPDLRLGLGARGDITRSDAIASNLYGLEGSAQYRQALWFGQATAGYNFAYNRRDQKAAQPQAQVLGESVRFTGVSVSLLRSPVIAGSVVVSNPARTQTFVENTDYKLSLLGTRQQIELLSGSIKTNDVVLVDYLYDTGGSYATSQFDNSFNLGWAYRSYLSVFLRYTDSAVSLISGEPTVPINPSKSTIIGARTDLPMAFLDQAFQFSATVERENRREVLTPYKRTSFDANILTDVPLLRDSNLWLGTRRLQTDYDLNPEQAVRMVGYDVRLSVPLGWGVDLNAEATRSRDTGSSVLKENSFALVKLKWRKRKLQASFDIKRDRDTVGAFERSRTLAQFLLRRDF